MIPEIGTMIGCYIITKLLYLTGKDDATTLIKILSLVSILVTVVVVADLIVRGYSKADGLPNIR
ncbi:MAG: hypothetical protein WC836_14635 [Desulfobacula sp.]|jgi:hypothetical protein